MSHFKDKIHQIRFPSVRPWFRSSLRWSLTHNVLMVDSSMRYDDHYSTRSSPSTTRSVDGTLNSVSTGYFTDCESEASKSHQRPPRPSSTAAVRRPGRSRRTRSLAVTGHQRPRNAVMSSKNGNAAKGQSAGRQVKQNFLSQKIGKVWWVALNVLDGEWRLTRRRNSQQTSVGKEKAEMGEIPRFLPLQK